MSDIPLRFIVIHIHPTSARLRFLKFDHGQLCMPAPLPKLSEWLDDRPELDSVAIHPKHWFHRACEETGLPEDKLSIESGIRLWVETPSGALPVYMLRVDGPDPFMAPDGGKWIELPDCFAMLPLERLLMQGIYTFLLE